MILISGDAAALVKGRPPLTGIPSPHAFAFVIISCRCRQSTASPLISHVTYDRPTRRSARCLRFPQCFRRRGGDTYALSSFCVCPSAALERDQPDILVSWLPVLAVIPSDASQRFPPAWIVRATLPRIPGESTQLLPLLCGCLMHCLYPPAPRSASGGA